ncbi:MAG: acylphosphatase [Pseudomonadota bacterium]|nr:acylphosphatase [Pseudomonadota bacterium]
MERLRLVVTGRVQGVAFRAHTQAEAARLGLVGWVRNLPDGTVELAAEGPREALEALLAWARTGPSMARVTGVEPAWGPATGAHAGFSIVRG